MRSLSQFQALQDGEQELVALRELGLTEAEVQLWLKRETPEQEDKVHLPRPSPAGGENIYISADTGGLPVASRCRSGYR